MSLPLNQTEPQEYAHAVLWETYRLHAKEKPQPGGAYNDIQTNILETDLRGESAYVPEVGDPNAKVAIVGFGPSLQYTWEGLEGYDIIWTCSKAHDFLLSKGIKPTHHTDVDFREHKAFFNKTWVDGVKYIIATQVHKAYLDKMYGADVGYFHCYIELDPPYTYPDGYPKHLAQWDAGTQACQMAYDMGYKKQDWFGFDYSNWWQGRLPNSNNDIQSHAGPHEGMKTQIIYTKTNGKIYETSHHHLAACFATLKMLNQYPDMDIRIYSDGLLLNFLEERNMEQ